LNVLMGITILSAAFSAPAGIASAVLAALFVFSVVNLTGGCVCKKNRIAGGAMMLISVIPLLLMGAVWACVPLIPADFLAAAGGMAFTEDMMRSILALGVWMLLVELTSGAAAVCCLALPPKFEREAYAPLYSAPADAPAMTEQSFAKNYAGYMKNNGDGDRPV